MKPAFFVIVTIMSIFCYSCGAAGSNAARGIVTSTTARAVRVELSYVAKTSVERALTQTEQYEARQTGKMMGEMIGNDIDDYANKIGQSHVSDMEKLVNYQKYEWRRVNDIISKKKTFGFTRLSNNNDDELKKVVELLITHEETEVNMITNEIRSTYFTVAKKDRVIYIHETKTHVTQKLERQKAFQDLFNSLKKKGELSACIEISSDGEIVINLTGKYNALVPFEIKVTSDYELEVQSMMEGGYEGLKVVHKLPLLPGQVEEPKVTKLTNSICYPFHNTQVELSYGDYKWSISPREVTFEF